MNAIKMAEWSNLLWVTSNFSYKAVLQSRKWINGGLVHSLLMQQNSWPSGAWSIMNAVYTLISVVHSQGSSRGGKIGGVEKSTLNLSLCLCQNACAVYYLFVP